MDPASLTALTVLADAPGSSTTPIGAAAADILSYILGYGVLGVAAVLFVLRIIVPRGAIAEGRADLEKENQRLRDEKAAEIERLRNEKQSEIEQLRKDREKVEEQRDEALRIAQVQLVPLLVNFTATTSALVPLLQQVVQHQEGHGGGATR